MDLFPTAFALVVVVVVVVIVVVVVVVVVVIWDQLGSNEVALESQ